MKFLADARKSVIGGSASLLPILLVAVGALCAAFVTTTASGQGAAKPSIPRPAQPIPIGSRADNEALPKNISSELDVFPRSEYDDLYAGLHDICPCFLIRIRNVTRPGSGAPTRRRGGEIIIRHPGDTEGLSEQELDFSGEDVVKPAAEVKRALSNVRAADFCDCYKRYRASCNLLWKVATAPNGPPVIWKRGLGETSAATPGHVGWNSADGDSGRSQIPSRTDRPSDRTTTKRPPSIGLAHEFAHAYNASYNRLGSTNPADDNFEEFQATRMENQVRAEMLADVRRDGKERSNTTLKDDDFGKLGPRVEYNPGQTVPNPGAGTIPMDDLFDCPKEVGFIPGRPLDAGGPGRKSTGLLTKINRSELIDTPSKAGPKFFQSPKANVSTDSQKFCTFGRATPTPVAFAPSDKDGNPLAPDDELARALALAAAGPTSTIDISNPDPDNAPKQNKPGKGGAPPTTARG